MNKDIENILKDVDAIKESNDKYEIDFLKYRIKIACQALKGMDVEYDQGPWTVWQDKDAVGLGSNEFNHDVSLRISGDFYNTDSKLTYARKLADQLNQTIGKIDEVKLPAGLSPIPYLAYDKEEPAYSKEKVDSITEMYTRNRNVTWHLLHSNSSGIGTSVDLIFSDGKKYDVTNYDIW